MMSADECNKKFFLDIPYPEIKVTQPNVDYAKILLNDYASSVSEFTAISQYVYGYLRLSKSYPEIANALLCIAKVEMHHLSIIGSLIVELGEDPKYAIIRRNRTLFWDASFVKYDQTVGAILRQNIKDEQLQIDEYNNSIDAIDDPNIKQILNRIILDEQNHIKILQEIINETPNIY